MKKVIPFLSLLMLSILLFTACKKTYPDDPYFINFRSPEARIHGSWDLESLIIGDHDSTAAFKNQPCYTSLYFLDKYDMERSSGHENLQGANWLNCYVDGFYKFTNNYNDLCLSFYNPSIRSVGSFPSNNNNGACWQIKKLTGSQLWLEATYNNLLSKAHLKKI